jgi:hypothetical protein
MAKKLSDWEVRQQVAEMKKQLELQEEINKSLDSYLSAMDKVKEYSNEILKNEKLIKHLTIKKGSLSGKAAKNEQKKIDYLIEQNKRLKEQSDLLEENLKTASKTKMVFLATAKGISALPKLIERGFGKIKSYGLFEMDKAIKQSSLSMGLLSTQSSMFRQDIKNASKDTIEIGVGIEDLAKIQSQYSDEIGRSVMLNESGLKAISQIAVTTGLGVDGAAQMAAHMEQQGYSAERTAEFVNQTMNDASKMGLNASKVVKNIQSNIKLLNRYNFKGGINGLKKMAETVTKLGVDMNFATGMADKLFDIEGAVDMSAQLQVMGGAWSKLADPFHLMYMARNDMAGLTEEIGKAAESSVTFSKDGGLEISALEMHRLRKIAEQTGIAYEDLAQAGKNARKQTEIRKQMSFNVDDETREFLANTAKFTEKGEAYIEVKGEKKMLKTLSEADRTFLKNQLQEKQNLEERAKAARSFDEVLNNTINLFKSSLLPFLETLSDKLIKNMDNFVEKIKKERWLERIEYFAGEMGKLIGVVGGWIIDNPWTSIVGLLIANKAQWIANGLLLAQGFNMGTMGKGGGPGGTFAKSRTAAGYTRGVDGKMSPMSFGQKAMGKNVLGGRLAMGTMGSMAAGAGLGIAGIGLDYGRSKMDDPESTGGKLLGVGSSALKGAGIGMMFGPWGAAIGGVLGGLYGAYDEFIAKGEEANSSIQSGVQDGLFHGTNKSRRAILQNGQVTPIDNKDDLLALKKDGIIDKNIGSKVEGGVIKHEFGDIKITGELVLTTPGGERVSIEILKDPQVIRQLTRMIHVETEKVIQGGKSKG